MQFFARLLPISIVLATGIGLFFASGLINPIAPQPALPLIDQPLPGTLSFELHHEMGLLTQQAGMVEVDGTSGTVHHQLYEPIQSQSSSAMLYTQILTIADRPQVVRIGPNEAAIEAAEALYETRIAEIEQTTTFKDESVTITEKTIAQDALSQAKSLKRVEIVNENGDILFADTFTNHTLTHRGIEPSGRWLAYATRHDSDPDVERGDLVIVSTEGSDVLRLPDVILSEEGQRGFVMNWSPDGERLLHVSPEGEQVILHVIQPATQQVEKYAFDGDIVEAQWSANGSVMVLQ